MKHTLIYYGNYDLNHDLLTPETTTRVTSSGSETLIKSPSDKVDGIVFGYMEDPPAFYAVTVGNVVLRHSIRILKDRHADGKGFGPRASMFGDASARRLLDDIIAANPSQEQDLAVFYSKISPVVGDTPG